MNNKKSIAHGWKDIKVGILISLALNFMLLVYAPLELFFTNCESFWFDFALIFPVISATFIASLFLSIFIYACAYAGNQKLYNTLILISFILMICSYIQGNFLSQNLPPLDGTDVNWSLYFTGRISSLVLWICVSGLTIIGVIKCGFRIFFKAVSVISVCLTLMLGISLIVVGISTGSWRSKGTLVATTKNQFQMSSDSNFIILLLDALDAYTFSEILTDTPVYRYVFEDFTYYDNTVCAYPYTKHSIPFILSGEWYENNGDFEKYTEKAYGESPLFSWLEEEQYTIGLYDADISIQPDSIDKYDNLIANRLKISSYPNFVNGLLKLGGIKYAPFELKKYCYAAPEILNNSKRSNDNIELFDWGNLPFYSAASNKENISFTDNRSFKFIHLEGAHVPYRYDKDMNLIENGTYRDNVEACITMSYVYLQKLKNAGVYDNSIIIIMGDHGYNEDQLEGRQNPVLMIKGLNEKHDMKISAAPISYEDLQEAYSLLLSGNQSDEIFNYQEGEYRERRYLLYEYEKDNHMVEYIQTGPAHSLDTLIPTGKEYNSQ